MTYKKWRKRRQTKQDPHQATLTTTSQEKMQRKQNTTKISFNISEGPFLCPFCLHLGKIDIFLISTAKGYHRGLGQCPECKNQFRWTTLTAEWTPEQYAEWVYDYSQAGFWQKIPYKTWSERLRKIGWSARFWRRYKQLKGEDTETPQNIITKQEKMRYECPKCGEPNQPGSKVCTYCETPLPG